MASRPGAQGHHHLRQPQRPSHQHNSSGKSLLHHSSRRYEQAFLLLILLFPAAFLDISEATYSYDPGPEFEPAPGGLNVTTFTGQTSRLPCSVKHLNGKTVSWIRGRDLQVLSSDRHTFATDIRISVLPGPSQKSAFDRQWKPIKPSLKGKNKIPFKRARLRRSLVEGHSRVGHPVQGGHDGETVGRVRRKEISEIEGNSSYVNTPRHRSGGVSSAMADTILRWERPYQMQSAETVTTARRVKRLPVKHPEISDDNAYLVFPGIHHHSHRRDRPHHLNNPRHRYDLQDHYPHQHHRQQHVHKTHSVQDPIYIETQSSGDRSNYRDHLQTLQDFPHYHQKLRNYHAHIDDEAPLLRTLAEESATGGEPTPLRLSHLLDSKRRPQHPPTISHRDPHLQIPSLSSLHSPSGDMAAQPSRPTEKVNSHSKRSYPRTFSSKHSSSFSSSSSSSSLRSSSNSPYSGSSYSNSNDLTLDWRADDFTLQIKYTEPGDAGTYICQVNTEPSMVQVVTLNVIDMEAEIVGKRELYVKAGTPVVLKCRVRHGDLMPGFIFWYKGKRLVDYTSSGGRIRVLTSPDGQSQLVLESALPSDSGNYTCYPPGGTTASVQLGVIVDERPAAMQQGNGGSTTFTTATTATTTASSAIVFPSLPTTVTSVTLFVSSLLTKCDLLDLQLGETLLRLALSAGAMMALLTLLNSGATFLVFLGVSTVVIEFLRQGYPWEEASAAGRGKAAAKRTSSDLGRGRSAARRPSSSSSSSSSSSAAPYSHSHHCFFPFLIHFFFRILLPVLLFLFLLFLSHSLISFLPLSYPVSFYLSFPLYLAFFSLIFFSYSFSPFFSSFSSPSSYFPSASSSLSHFHSQSLPSPSHSSPISASPTGPASRAKLFRSSSLEHDLSVKGDDEETAKGLTQVRYPENDRLIPAFRARRDGRRNLKIDDKQGVLPISKEEEGEERFQSRYSRTGDVVSKRREDFDVETRERPRQLESSRAIGPRTR